ncbi:MAG: hypothetical protein WCV68_00745 [Candidatus Paceibacterota bacterium]|jgi:hypothetical protein
MTPEQESAFHLKSRGEEQDREEEEEDTEEDEEDIPRKFPEPYAESPTDSEAEKDFKRIMRESQAEEEAENRLYKTENIEESVREMVDPDFEISGRMLFSDTIHFWPTPVTREQFNSMGTEMRKAMIFIVPHYRQGYQKHQNEYLAQNRENFDHYGPKTFEREKAFGDRYIGRIMELSDPNQIRKYDKLVDEFNADRERIIREKDYDSLREYLAKVRSLVNEIK